jgi:hypothetical protein
MHTQAFAFRAQAEDEESVKLTNTTSSRTSALPPALPSPRSGIRRRNKGEFLLDTNEFLRAQAFARFCAAISLSPVTHYHSTHGEF